MSDIPLHHWFSGRRSFLDRTLADLNVVLDHASAAPVDGFLTRLDPRVKLGGAVALMLQSASATRVEAPLAITGIVLATAALARLPMRPVVRLAAATASLAVVLAVPPAFFSPDGLAITARLLSRAVCSSTLAAVLIVSTPAADLTQAMRRFGLPALATTLVGMTYRYILLFVRTAVELTEARRSRTLGPTGYRSRIQLAVSAIAVLFERTFETGNEVHLAMQARGYRGVPRTFTEPRLGAREWMAAGCLVLLELILYRSFR